ncbi:TPA: hypothetical protein ACWP4A_004215, partial [Escherichia coli]
YLAGYLNSVIGDVNVFPHDHSFSVLITIDTPDKDILRQTNNSGCGRVSASIITLDGISYAHTK